jgi:hypothetical protein
MKKLIAQVGWGQTTVIITSHERDRKCQRWVSHVLVESPTGMESTFFLEKEPAHYFFLDKED